MTERELNRLLMETFPELQNELKAYMEEDGDGMDTGCFLTHEDVLHGHIEAALAENDSPFLRRVGTYIEKLLSLNDEYADNVATVALVEWLALEHPSDVVRSSLKSMGRSLYDEYMS